MFSLLLEKSAYCQLMECSPHQNTTKFFTNPKWQLSAPYGNEHPDKIGIPKIILNTQRTSGGIIIPDIK